ncbi:hypothetical protein [Cellulomonas sp. P5_E12]
MGATNVRFALLQFGHLQAEHPWPMLVLVALANITLDDDSDGRPARTFWGGFGYLAECMDGRLPAEPDQDDDSDAATDARRVRANRFRAIRRAYPVLLEAGALTRARKPAPGRPTQYRLNLSAFDAADAGRSATHERGTPSDHDAGRSATMTRDAQRPHRKKKEKKEQETGQHPARLSSHQSAAHNDVHDDEATQRRAQLDRHGAAGLAAVESIRTEHPELSVDGVVVSALARLNGRQPR